MGQTLGKQLVKSGRSVCYGSRNPKALQQELGSKGLAAEALSVHEAVSRSDVLILAVPGEDTRRGQGGISSYAAFVGHSIDGDRAERCRSFCTVRTVGSMLLAFSCTQPTSSTAHLHLHHAHTNETTHCMAKQLSPCHVHPARMEGCSRCCCACRQPGP